MLYDLGIDVGTSFTAAAVRRSDGTVEVVGLGPIADNIPTVVYLSENGSLLVGDAAARRVVIDPAGAAREFKRRMGDPTPLILRTSPFSAEALLRHMVERVVQQVADREGEMPRSTVVTHPANWGPYKLDLFDQALRMAEIGPVSRVSEPHAAATAYASQARVPDGSTVGVYDLGGGTFDAAVLRKDASGFSLLGESVGIEHLGGVDFDEAVLHHVRSALGARWPVDSDDPALLAPMMHLRRACTDAKELLSSESTVTIPVLLPGLDTTVALDRRRFETMITPRIEDTVSALDAAMRSAGLQPHDLHQLLLVGGSSRIPLVARMLEDRYSGIVARDVDPLFAVALGAAIVAGQRAGAIAPAPVAPVAEVPRMRDERPTVTPAPRTPGPAPQADPAAAPESVAPYVPSRANRRPVIAAIGALAVLVAGGVYFATKEDTPTTAAVATTVVTVSSPPSATTAVQPAATSNSNSATTQPSDSEPPAIAPVSLPDPVNGMRPIPAGIYKIGSADSPKAVQVESEMVEKSITTPVFLDIHEVNNREYYDYWQATGAGIPQPASWGNGYSSTIGELPVTGIYYEFADHYCRSQGKRLPTEVEWEAAASNGASLGKTSSKYPWGEKTKTLPSNSYTYPVGSFAENVSAFGIFDLAGNAWEYVDDDSYESAVTLRELEHIVKGGQNTFVLRNSERMFANQVAFFFNDWAGFRCASDSPSPSPNPTIPIPEVPQLVQPEIPVGLAQLDLADNFRQLSKSHVNASSGDGFKAGVHPLEFFHLEAEKPNQIVVALAKEVLSSTNDFEIGTAAFVEENNTKTSPEAGFQYGIAFGISDVLNAPYLAFVVNPNGGDWAVLRVDGTEAVETIECEGNKPRTVQRNEPANRLVVRKVGANEYNFFYGTEDEVANNEALLTSTPCRIGGFETGDQVGLFLRNFENSEKTHIHFKLLYFGVKG